MPKEAVVVILDANESMTALVDNKTTRFECAKEACIAIISDLMFRSKTNEVTVVVLHTESTKNFFFDELEVDSSSDQSEFQSRNPFPNITEFSGNGEVLGIRPPLPGLLRTIQGLQPSYRKDDCAGGDFESGLVYAADCLHRRTSGKQFDRRIVLVTDAEHRVGKTKEEEKRILVAIDCLRIMDCRVQIVGLDFEQSADFDLPLQVVSSSKVNTSETGVDENDDIVCGEEGRLSRMDVKYQNEEYLIRLAHTTGGFVYASKELKGMLDKVMGSRVVQNPTKRKLRVEIAPGLVLENARFYKLISKTPSLPLKKKIVMVDHQGQPLKNSMGVEMLQDFETTVTHWNTEDENEELLGDRLSYAYRFGSDLLPFSPLDEAGLIQRSPVLLAILGYMPKTNIPDYLRTNAPYVLSGNDSRRCCAAISALARALYRTEQVAIATFVQNKDKDPILCGLFPLVEPSENDSIDASEEEEPLRLIIVQLPFQGDVKYPRREDLETNISKRNVDEKKEAASAKCCDDLIDSLMLPESVLEYEFTPDHRVRSFYKTVVQRVLDPNAQVVPTRIDPITGVDSMDTPSEIRNLAEPFVSEFYKTFRLTKTEI